MSVEDAKALSAEHITALKNLAIENADAEIVKKMAAEEGGEESQVKTLSLFERESAKRKKLGSILDRMDEKRFANVQHKQHNPDPIIRV